MELLTLIQGIPATFWGIVLGSLLTVIGVVLTNASNTRRLRLQHEHERAMESKNRDLNLRKEVYLAAMEAVSAGMVAVGRYSDLGIPQQELMQSYTDRSPSIGKVTIVGSEGTIQAVTNFNQELTGAFLRLGSMREKVDALGRHATVLEKEIERASQEQDRLVALVKQGNGAELDDKQRGVLQRQVEVEQERVAALQAGQAEIDGKLFAAQIDLVQQSVAQTTVLDRLLVPVISRMRSELELPFDEAFYAQLIEEGHKKQAAFLEEFIRDQAGELEQHEANL
jgi:hypothetical protein